jgi:hypothetical protein
LGDFTTILLIWILANVLLCVSVAPGLCSLGRRAICWCWQVYLIETVGSLLKNPWTAKAKLKNDLSIFILFICLKMYFLLMNLYKYLEDWKIFLSLSSPSFLTKFSDIMFCCDDFLFFITMNLFCCKSNISEFTRQHSWITENLIRLQP